MPHPGNVASFMKKRFKKLLLGLLLLFALGAVIVVYVFSEKFTDTVERKPLYTVSAADFIKEFQENDSIANKKYTEKIVAVNGIISEVVPADTTVNIVFKDEVSGDYVIFAFQQQHLQEAKTLKAGQAISIKGSCSGGNYSEILGTRYISFKRSAVNK